jgi:hypothetical protein
MILHSTNKHTCLTKDVSTAVMKNWFAGEAALVHKGASLTYKQQAAHYGVARCMFAKHKVDEKASISLLQPLGASPSLSSQPHLQAPGSVSPHRPAPPPTTTSDTGSMDVRAASTAAANWCCITYSAWHK